MIAEPAIVVCTTNAKCLDVMKASIKAYVPREIRTYVSHGLGPTFGEAYNEAARIAFKEHDQLVICNDDIVFTPTTWMRLMGDVRLLREHYLDLGWVATRSDYARGEQNIRCGRGQIDFLRFPSERNIVQASVIAPICAWIHRASCQESQPFATKSRGICP